MTDQVDTAEAGTPGWRSGVPQDLRAGIILFLIALPLCLGVASATGVPPLSGLISGMVGGILVAALSGSPLTIAGPAAGLTVVVIDGVQRLGFREFLLAALIGGVAQVVLGLVGAGRLAQVVPAAVIRGMLAAIGLILVLKQLPHALGYDADPEGDLSFAQRDGHNTFSELFYSLESIAWGAVLVSAVAGITLLLWRNYGSVQLARYVPRELMAVATGLVAALLLEGTAIELAPEHRVSVPSLSDNGLLAMWTTPAWSAITRVEVWTTGLTLALIASIESLLCLEATDRIDPLHRLSPPNRELLAQGIGNVTSSALGGLPVTAVIVRSFANVQAGGRSRLSSITHGVLLLVATLGFSRAINHIPLAALAAVLVMVGYKLTPPSLYRDAYKRGGAQFWPFLLTIVAILLTDLLTGTLLGFLSAVLFFVWGHYSAAMIITNDGTYRMIRFAHSVSFLHRAQLKASLESVQSGGHVIIDGARARAVDPDILDAIADFREAAPMRGVKLTIQRSESALHHYFRGESRL